jgi:2-polyprenyl-6-methoxyphenol hydroxylase-like FAD-dependent oxidoreductase
VAASRTILIAGAGIGGLSAAKALADKGFRVVIYEQADRPQETGAGIQLSPNATRALMALGVADKLEPRVVVPETVSIRQAASGRELARIPLGADIAFRYGTPYWVMHRADLHSVLLDAVKTHPDIVLKTGLRVEDFAVHAHGATIELRKGMQASDERGICFIAADGLWSRARTQLTREGAPRFRGRKAWRTLIDAEHVRDEFRKPAVRLWLGKDAHLVHYPVSSGKLINVVAIVDDKVKGEDWSMPGRREDILKYFSARHWATAARDLINEAEQWQTWSLYDRPARWRWGHGAMTLLGDAAHPALPFIAQGAAMAIEDAVTLAQCLTAHGIEPVQALRLYEGMRRRRTARVQRASRATGRIYHLSGPLGALRDAAIARMGGEKLRERYDWLYDWRRV